MYLIMVCELFVWCSLCVRVCMLTVSNALLISSATVIVRSGGLFWLNPVVMVLFMLCSAVLVEWLLLKPCCVEMCGMLFVMYGSSVFSSVFAITERSEMGLYICSYVHVFVWFWNWNDVSKFQCMRDDVVV